VLPKGIKEIRTVIDNKIPDSFVAEVKNGTLHIQGIEQPFYYNATADDSFKELSATSSLKNAFLMVIDTVNPTSSLSLNSLLDKNSASGVLVTQSQVEIYDAKTNRTQIQYIKDIPDGALTKNDIKQFADKLTNPLIAVILIFIFIAFYIGTIISKLVSILIVSVIALIVSSISGKTWKFGELFTVGLFAITLPSVLNSIATLVGVHIPYLFTLILLAFMLALVLTKDGVKNIESTTNQDEKPTDIVG
jgi:hypothetical protein